MFIRLRRCSMLWTCSTLLSSVRCNANTENLLGELQHFSLDFKDVRGQQTSKRALEVAAAGSQMIGLPGSGKTMLPSACPPSSLHIGGIVPRPGEVSLAHNGLLFLDELPEFPRNLLEAMRQPLEDHTVTIARASMSLSFPARFMLTAAMNPYPYGYFNDKSRECLCTPPMIQRYVAKISGPLLDRIDIHIEAPAVQYKELRGDATAEDSAEIRCRVMSARQRQPDRFKKCGEKIFSNAQMYTRQIRAHCELNPDAKRQLERAMQQQGLTARVHDQILKVCAHWPTLEGTERLAASHLAVAISVPHLWIAATGHE
jgi:magnesium chelatase family protein